MDKTKLTIEYFFKEFNKIAVEINKDVGASGLIKAELLLTFVNR